MKKTLATLGLFALTMVSANAQILFQQDNFTWTAGNLAGQNGWAAHSGAGNSTVQVNTVGDFSLVQGSGTREDVNRDVGAIQTGQTYYAAFNVSVSGNATITNSYFAHFMNGSTNFRSRVWVTEDSGLSGDFRFAFSNGSNIESTWAENLTFNTIYTVVISFTQDTGAASLWVNPTSISSTSISATPTTQTPAISSVAFRQSAGNTTQTVSDLVVGTDFNATLAAVPEPSTWVLIGLGFGFVLWSVRRNRRSVA